MPDPTDPPKLATVNVDQLVSALSAVLKANAPPSVVVQAPEADLGRLGAWAKFAAGLTLDKLLAFALIIGFGFVLYQGPIIYGDVTAQNSRVQQEEQERTRQLFNEINERNNRTSGEQTKLVIQAFSLNSKETGRLAATVERLESAVNRLNTKVGGPPMPPMPDDPCSLPWWDRMLDGAPRDANNRVRDGLGHGAGQRQGPGVVVGKP